MTEGDTDGTSQTGSDDGSSFVEYGIEDEPPLSTSVLLGVQHYLTMVGANIAVPLILAGAMGMPAGVTAKFVGTFFVVSGIATLAQTTFGNRYPIVQGAPFSMLAPALAIVATAPTLPGGVAWESKLLFLQGAIIAAATTEVFIGYLGIVGRLRRLLSPVVVAPTIALIGLSLFNVPQITAPDQNWWLLGLTVGLVVLFSQYLGDGHRVFQLFPVLLAIVLSWLVAAGLSVTGVLASGTKGYVDLASVTDVELVFAIYPLQWGMPRFEAAFAIGMFAGVLASIVESFGDYHAVARLTGSGAPSESRINHGIGMEGLMNVFAGIMGAGGSTSYSENIGAIGLTGVASRRVVQVGAAVMLVVGFFGPFGQLIATIPAPIVGGLFVAMFGQIVAVGLSNLEYVDLDSSRNVFVIGIALFTGLAIPNYMNGLEGVAALKEGLAGIAVLGPVLGTDPVANTLFVIGGTGMAVGGLVALLLDNTIPGTDEERGVAAWEDVAEDESDFSPVWAAADD
ncbi:uracil-xanthine permease family protein [Haloarchaeobius amylolyticus]|uniref:uracil-xanthine permease family protein n=1 Tax=Haloarchaeobius amylolyticus TaxID=1198296 RepID=UPI00226F1E58|nr:solute carrier family 23 protein [Haloarchaeobius amylolyticus]